VKSQKGGDLVEPITARGTDRFEKSRTARR
jgi:hypothetical protein